MIDETHDPARQSWVPGADDHPEFPIQNLPFGIFSPQGKPPQAGIAIGDHILDLAACNILGLFEGDALHATEAASGGSLNAFLALGAGPRRALRRSDFPANALITDASLAVRTFRIDFARVGDSAR